MEVIKNISLGICYGVWDSIKGMTLVFYIDSEMHRLNEESLAEERNMRRYSTSRSPTPTSASTMDDGPWAVDESFTAAKAENPNPDERRLESIRKKESVKEMPKRELKIAKQVFKCCVLNGGFTWASIIVFEHLILPMLKYALTLCYGDQSEQLNSIWGWLRSLLSILFSIMWVLPIFVLSKIVSSLWFADIANAAYRVRKGRPRMISGISKLLADFLFSLLVQMMFLVQSMLVNMLPIRWIASSLCFLHLCLLYSLYSFEYKWFNMGWELHRRLSYIEGNWPYFLGFGIPLTVLTNLSNSIIASSCIFSIFFPLFILSGNEARPLVGTTGTPMRIFSPVIFVSNLFFILSPRTHKANNVGSRNKQLPPPMKPIQHIDRSHREHFEEMRRLFTTSNRRPSLSRQSSVGRPLVPTRTTF